MAGNGIFCQPGCGSVFLHLLNFVNLTLLAGAIDDVAEI
jgi:hypothetical protein